MTSFVRSGPLEAGEWVRLTDPKGRKHNLRLEAGAAFSTKKGQLSHDDMIGHPEGIVIESSMGAPYQVFRPLLFEYVVSMPRGAAIIYPKDAAQIVTMADIYPGARVVEAGAGSGSLTTYLLRAIGPEGTLGSYEIREEFADNVRRNVEQVAGPDVPGWSLTVGDVRETITETEIDRLILDMVDPWTCIPLAAERLVPGGIVCAYVATTTQLSMFVESIREDGGFTEPHAWETMLRTWHLEGRPHRLPRDGPQDGARTAVAREVAEAGAGSVRTRLPRSEACSARRRVAEPSHNVTKTTLTMCLR